MGRGVTDSRYDKAIKLSTLTFARKGDGDKADRAAEVSETVKSVARTMNG